MYAIVKEGVVERYPIVRLEDYFKNISFSYPITEDQLPTNVFMVHRSRKPDFDPAVENISEGAPQYVSGKYVQSWQVLPKTTEEVGTYLTSLRLTQIERRNQLLSESDWTQLPDVTVDKSAWATYRQALRDVPLQQGFPHNVVWPTPPQ